MAIWLAFSVVCLFGLLGLVVDGGRALAAAARDQAVAFAAARAGATALSPAGLASGSVVLSPPAATAAAEAVLHAAGASGTVVVQGQTVTVEVASTTASLFGPLSGLARIPVAASATADAERAP